jgi:type IV secretory pathway TraG/TraD family ATPase VirD4
LLTPDEVRNLPAHGQLLFLAGQRPIVAAKLAYYADPEFNGAFDPTMTGMRGFSFPDRARLRVGSARSRLPHG